MSGSGHGRRRVVTVIAALGVSAGLLAAVISRVDSDHAWTRLAHARWGLIGLSLLLAFVLLVFRSLRFATLIPGVGLGVMMSCTALQNLLLRVTPFRLGELGLPYLIARRTGQPAMRSLVALILVRGIEVLAFALLGLIAVLIVFGGHAVDRLIIAVPATVVLVFMVATFATWVRLGYRVFAAVVAHTPLGRVAAATRLVQQLAQIVEQDARLDSRQRWALGLTTVTISCLQIVMYGALLRAFGVELSVARTAVGVTMAIGFGSLPLPTVGNVGTHETGWTLGFQAMGVSVQDAVVTGVASGLLTLGFAVVFAIPAALLHIARSPSR